MKENVYYEQRKKIKKKKQFKTKFELIDASS